MSKKMSWPWTSKSIHKRTSTDLQFNQWTVHWIQKSHRKNLTIKLSAKNGIQIYSNLGTSEKEVFAFLKERQSWIEKHLNRFAKKAALYNSTLRLGEIYHFRGLPKTLSPSMTLLDKAFVSIFQDRLQFHWPHSWPKNEAHHQLELRRQVLHFYQREAKTYLLSKVQQWSELTQLYPRKIAFRNQRSRWGSCSAKGHLSLNWRMMALPDSVIDYILVHELCHLEFMDHSSHFWKLVQHILPDFQESEKFLRDHGSMADFLLL